jgi:hypothetical protein
MPYTAAPRLAALAALLLLSARLGLRDAAAAAEFGGSGQTQSSATW